MCRKIKKGTWNRQVHEVWSVTSECQFHLPKRCVQAPHCSWNDQRVATWKISSEHPMPWRLSMRTKIRKLHKKKTMQRKDHWMRTRDPVNFPGWVRLWKVLLQSKAISPVCNSAILSRVRFGPWQHGQLCALTRGMQLEEVDHGIQSFNLGKVYRQTKVRTVKKLWRFMWEWERTTKASTDEWFPYFVVCVGRYDCTIVQECLGCCRVQLTSIRDVAGIRWFLVSFRYSKRTPPQYAAHLHKKQVRTILKKLCVFLLGNHCFE